MEQDFNKALNELYKATGLQFVLVDTASENTTDILEQINHLTNAYKEKYNKTSFIHELLAGDLSSSDIFNRAQKLHIDFDARRVIYIIEVANAKEKTMLETLKHLFMPLKKDFIVEFNSQNIILVKTLNPSDTSDKIDSISKTIVDMLNTEAMSKVRIGYSSEVSNLSQLHTAYKEARLALDVGTVFYMNRTTISHTSLGIGRLIYHLPPSLCKTFLYEIFGHEPPTSFDDETLTTINVFFENGLNIAETARQLYIHRNTLIYRLEKLQKWTGLDLRSFDDALLFKIATMVVRHLEHK